MAAKLKLEIAGVIENMSGFVTPGGERFQIFGEGGGQLLAEELDVPLLAKVPLTMPLREQSDAGLPLVMANPDDPAAQALRHGARGLIALSPDRASGHAGARAGRGPQAGRHVAADGLSCCSAPGAPRPRPRAVISRRSCSSPR